MVLRLAVGMNALWRREAHGSDGREVGLKRMIVLKVWKKTRTVRGPCGGRWFSVEEGPIMSKSLKVGRRLVLLVAWFIMGRRLVVVMVRESYC